MQRIGLASVAGLVVLFQVVTLTQAKPPVLATDIPAACATAFAGPARTATEPSFHASITWLPPGTTTWR